MGILFFVALSALFFSCGGGGADGDWDEPCHPSGHPSGATLDRDELLSVASGGNASWWESLSFSVKTDLSFNGTREDGYYSQIQQASGTMSADEWDRMRAYILERAEYLNGTFCGTTDGDFSSGFVILGDQDGEILVKYIWDRAVGGPDEVLRYISNFINSHAPVDGDSEIAEFDEFDTEWDVDDTESEPPVCHPPCDYFAHQYCGVDEQCHEVRCVFCDSTAGCGVNERCLTVTFDDNSSAAICSSGCASDADCPAGFTCLTSVERCFPLALCGSAGDGDQDLESDRDVDGDREPEIDFADSESDGDTQPHTGPACDDVSMISPSTDPQVMSAAFLACWDYTAAYADPEIATYHAYLQQTCQPVEVSFGEYGRAVVCEVAHRDGDLPTDNPSWPGPGYGCVWGPNIGDVITGWYGGVGGYSEQENTCHDQWTEGTWAFVLDRQPRDPTPCSTIGDLWTCLHTHNHPYHCQPLFGWDLVWDGSVCEVREMSSFTGDELNEARFIGCRTVHEFYFDREVERGCRPYTGPIRNLATGECLGYDYRECAIPSGWRTATCDECQRPADGDGEAE